MFLPFHHRGRSACVWLVCVAVVYDVHVHTCTACLTYTTTNKLCWLLDFVSTKKPAAVLLNGTTSISHHEVNALLSRFRITLPSLTGTSLAKMMTTITEPQRKAPKKEHVSQFFYFLFTANILMYVEAGAVPASLLPLAASFSMSLSAQGLLGGIVFLSIAFAGPFAGVHLLPFIFF